MGGTKRLADEMGSSHDAPLTLRQESTPLHVDAIPGCGSLEDDVNFDFDAAPVDSFWTPPQQEDLTPRSQQVCQQPCSSSFPIRLRTWLRDKLNNHGDGEWSVAVLDDTVIHVALMIQGCLHDGLSQLHLADALQTALDCAAFTVMERAFLRMLLDKAVSALRSWSVIVGPTARPLTPPTAVTSPPTLPGHRRAHLS